MLASFEHNFLFIKTRKTAGTSLEIELSRHCGAADIVTPIGPEDERFRIEEGVYPRNYSDDPNLEENYREILRSRNIEAALNFLTSHKAHLLYYSHMSAGEIRDRIDRRFWDRARKISIDRHPYEKVVSQAYFRKARYKRFEARTMDDIFEVVIAEGRYRNVDLYSIGGEIVADFLLRFEQLAQWPAMLTSRLQLPPLRDLPRAKGGYRIDNTAAKDILTAAQKLRIQEVCREEFLHFGWTR